MAPHWGPDGACPGPAGMLLLVGFPASPADYAARHAGGEPSTGNGLHQDAQHSQRDWQETLQAEAYRPGPGRLHPVPSVAPWWDRVWATPSRLRVLDPPREGAGGCAVGPPCQSPGRGIASPGRSPRIRWQDKIARRDAEGA